MRLTQLITGVALACAVALPAITSAQTTGSATPAQVQTAVKNALQSVNLTPRQKMKIAPMVQNYKEQTANADAATKKSDGEALLKNIYGVLTPDQQTKFKASLKSSLAGSSASP